MVKQRIVRCSRMNDDPGVLDRGFPWGKLLRWRGYIQLNSIIKTLKSCHNLEYIFV